jgi:Integrase core domain
LKHFGNGLRSKLLRHSPGLKAPRYLIRDRNAIYGAAVTRRLRAMGIRDKPIAPGSPWQNSFAERLIGSIRRECVDHVIALGEQHLRRVLKSYTSYYNSARTHRSLEIRRSRARFSRLVASCRMPWSADFTTSTPESEVFGTHKHSTGQYDDFARVPRARPGEGCRRRRSQAGPRTCDPTFDRVKRAAIQSRMNSSRASEDDPTLIESVA